MTYHPIYNALGQIVEWIDDEGNRYPENPEYVAAQIAEHEAYIESFIQPGDDGGVDDWGVPYDVKWNAHFE